MKIQSSTFLLVLAALLLGGVTLMVVQNSPPNEQTNQASQTGQTTQSDLFGFEERQVQALSVTTPLRSLKFERDKDGKWQMIEPDKTPASDASISFLLDLMASGSSERTFTAPASDREKYGFHQPFGTIEVKLDNQKTHKLVLGEYDFNRSFIYALADSSADAKADLKVSLVSPSFENAINRALPEWKQPPEPSPTPSASPSQESSSPTPSPSPENSPKASPSSSPAPSPEASPEASPSPNPAPSPEASPEASSSPSPTPSPGTP